MITLFIIIETIFYFTTNSVALKKKEFVSNLGNDFKIGITKEKEVLTILTKLESIVQIFNKLQVVVCDISIFAMTNILCFYIHYLIIKTN
jgi:hypothetical protein